MIRKLRLKIVGISVVTVAVVLVSALVILALSTRSQMAQSSEARLYEALEGKLDKSELPGSSGLPCFVAEVYSGGTIRLSGSSYYNLQDEEMVLHIVQAALEREDDSGVLGDYSLRYLRRIGVVSVRIAFTDCTMEQATMRSLLLRSGLVALAALAVLAGLSYCLAGLVVGPVKRAWQEQKQFVSDASHELKTPLTVILSSSELAAEEQDVQRTKQYVEGIHAESLRMKALVEDMLTLARTESGTRPETEAVDLSDTVLESVLAFEPVAFESGREFVYDIQPELTVMGSGVQLRRLTDILLDNAVKYAAEGTPIRLLLRQEGRCAALRVENRGETIPAEKLRHIFDRFYRADESRSGGEGFGLGLAIAQSIAQSHGGSIGCASEEGVTRFIVTLPLQKNETMKRGKEEC
ncbi:MAG: HAMP domain-containing histidine kinase [Clostridiales bacterium]|nr:HAMP domain-containing histidine kinase [Clostridiales bacterium]